MGRGCCIREKLLGLRLVTLGSARNRRSGTNLWQTNFQKFLYEPVKLELISPKDAQDLMMAVENGRMPLIEAYQLVQNLINSVK